MSRSYLSRASFRALFLTLFLGALIVACGGRVILLGSNQGERTPIDPDQISASIGACPAGYAHPNVCCTGGPNTVPVCTAYEATPFHPCDDFAATYPDPRTCCPVNGSGSCIASASGPPPTTTTSCSYTCPPGWWENPSSQFSQSDGGQSGNQQQFPSSPASCCRTDSADFEGCLPYYGGSASPDDSVCAPAHGDAGAPDFDASDSGDDAGDGGCDDGGGPSTPIPGLCESTCPAGWTPRSVASEICCRGAGDARQCFSRAVGGGGAPSATSGGGTSPAAVAGCWGTFASTQSDGGPAGCGCQGEKEGHLVELVCGGNRCACVVDGTYLQSLATQEPAALVCTYGPVWVSYALSLCGP